MNIRLNMGSGYFSFFLLPVFGKPFPRGEADFDHQRYKQTILLDNHSAEAYKTEPSYTSKKGLLSWLLPI